jgi:hypothetical protein
MLARSSSSIGKPPLGLIHGKSTGHGTLRYYSIIRAPKVGSSGLADFFLLENHARNPLPLMRATHELLQK